jgi:hypothetical protein
MTCCDLHAPPADGTAAIECLPLGAGIIATAPTGSTSAGSDGADVSLLRRTAILLACLAGGAAVGGIGFALGGSEWWFVALPLALAVGWWFVADPTRCER